MGILKKSCVQVYTGDGKGKTSAALGLSLRMLGAGGRVAFFQFFKDGASSEFLALSQFGERFYLCPCGSGCFLKGKPSQEDLSSARDGLARAAGMLASGDFDLVVLDEAGAALSCGLIELEPLLDALSRRNSHTEALLTGRGMAPEICALADLVTEMRPLKHPYDKGIPARKGIEW